MISKSKANLFYEVLFCGEIDFSSKPGITKHISELVIIFKYVSPSSRSFLSCVK